MEIIIIIWLCISIMEMAMGIWKLIIKWKNIIRNNKQCHLKIWIIILLILEVKIMQQWYSNIKKVTKISCMVINKR
jgi:hypothetical protein